MKKIKWILILIISILIIYFLIYFIQNYQIKTSLEKFNKQKIGIVQDDLIRCNWSIFSPEFAYVWFDNEGNISFDKQNKIFWDKNDWKNTSTGGTTIKNTTFPQLLKMVKEDCYQFQKDNYDKEREKKKRVSMVI